MLAGLQIEINALSAIIPDSFIFVLDGNDRTFLYKSSNCESGINEVLKLEESVGIEHLLGESPLYKEETMEHVCSIKRISANMFMGFVAYRKKFHHARLTDAVAYFSR